MTACTLLRRKAQMSFSVIFRDKTKSGVAQRLAEYDGPYFNLAAKLAAAAVLAFASEPKEGYALILSCEGNTHENFGRFYVYQTRDTP